MSKQSMIATLKSLVRLLCVFGAVVWTSACGKGIDEAVWTEEVRLHDGQMVQVWRRATAYASGFPNARRGADIEFELKYAPLGVHWKGDWDLRPISFEIFDGVPYLVLNFQLKKHCRDKKPTDYRAKILRWERGQWTEIPQAQFPLDRALLNLYRGYWGHGPADDARGGITWKHKAMEDGFNPDRPDTVKQYFDRRGTGDWFHCSRATEH